MEPHKDCSILVSVWYFTNFSVVFVEYICLLCISRNVCLSVCVRNGLMDIRFVSVPIIEATYELSKFGRVCVVCDAFK